MVTLRYLAYFLFTFNHLIDQEHPLPKILFSLIICLITENFYRSKKYQLFKSAIFFNSLITFINSGFYLFLWNPYFQVTSLDYWTKIQIHYFKEEYLLSYQLYFLYAAVHLNAIFYSLRKEFVPFYISLLVSVLLFLFALISFDRIPVDNYPNGFLDDALFRSFIHIVAILFVSYGYIIITIIYHRENPDPKKFSLYVLYIIYNFMMITENIINDNNFSAYTYSFPFVLLISYIMLVSNRKWISFMYTNMYLQYSVMSLSIGMIVLEDFLAYRIIWFMIGFSFYIFKHYSNSIHINK